MWSVECGVWSVELKLAWKRPTFAGNAECISAAMSRAASRSFQSRLSVECGVRRVELKSAWDRHPFAVTEAWQAIIIPCAASCNSTLHTPHSTLLSTLHTGNYELSLSDRS